MDTVSTKLEASRARLVQQGTQFLKQTNAAVGTFVGKGKKAKDRFSTDTRKAGEQLVTDTTLAGKSLAQGISAEARMWLDALDLEGRVASLPKLPASLDTRSVPSRAQVERELLAKLETALRDLTTLVSTRVGQLDALTAPPLPASTTPVAATPVSTPAPKTNGSRKTSNGAVAAVVVPVVPITGYDDMSAKDIVTRLERLTDDKAAAVLAYEAANKKRATVLRAAEQRLAAEA